jgi:hypothetical protein
MEQNKLRDLLKQAKTKGFQHPTIPYWAHDTELEQALLRRVSTTPEIESDLLSLIEIEPEFDSFNGKMLNQGRGYHRVELKTVLDWLLYITDKFDEDVALSNLKKFSQINHMPVQEFLAISGIAINSSIELSEDIRLIPFHEVPPCIVKDALDPALFKPEFLAQFGISPGVFSFLNHNPPKTVIVKPVKAKPKFQSPEDTSSNFCPESKALYEVCECITLVSSAAPLPIVNWVMPEDWVPCSGFIGGGWSTPVIEILDKTVINLTDDELLDLKSLFGKFCLLDQKIRDGLRIPIQRLNQARRRKNIADKAIDLGVALEALYVNDRSSHEQISFTLRLRASWHLSDNYEHRKELIDIFNKIYECRSRAVHTGKLDHNIKLKGRTIQTSDLLKMADELCVLSIRKVIKDSSYPNWESLILGAN